MSTRLFFSVLVASLLLPLGAGAQLRSGVAVSSILGTSERVLSATAPDAWELPARLRVSCADGTTACVRVDVWVTGSSAEAAARLAAALSSISSTALVPRVGLADVAHADSPSGRATLVVAMRDNVVFAVRSLATQADVGAVAARIDAAILAAPIGDERATRMERPEDLMTAPTPNASVTVAMPAGVLDVTVAATGGASARRTAAGWLLACDEGSTWELVAWGIDDHLRVGNLTITLDPMADETIRHPLGH